MHSTKSYFVTGATGNQGGAVARHLIKNGDYVLALTRDTGSKAAKQLEAFGAELVLGNLDDPNSFRDKLERMDGVFSVQAFTQGAKKEIAQGVTLANLAKEMEIGHLIYTSVIGADLNTGIPHWESKHEIEKHIRQLGIPFTIIRPTSFYENFLIPQVYSRLIKSKLITPANKNKVQQFISTEDVGRISTIIFMDTSKYQSETIELGAEQMDMREVAGVFSEVLGKEIKYQKLPALITRFAMGSDLYKMFNWINANDSVIIKDLQEVKKEFPGMLSLKEWIPLHFAH